MGRTSLSNQPSIIDKIKKLKELKPVVSDIIDDQGNQYVDLVMEGGGTLGIALLGYIYTLESIGIRFLSIGGASAGSIMALLLSCGPIDEKRSDWIEKKIRNKNFEDFMDGDADAKNFITNVIQQSNQLPESTKSGGFTDSLRRAWYFMCIIDNLSNEKKGLNPGKHFHDWLVDILNEKKINSYNDLVELRKKKPKGLKYRSTGKPVTDEEFHDPYFAELGIVAAEVTTETKVVFPRLASLYWKSVKDINPADFVRASMSIPIFFQPFELDNIPTDDASVERWKKEVNFVGTLPEKVVFVDGGIISNFPIDIFHNYNAQPTSPTFGVKIGYDRSRCNSTSGFLDYVGAIFWSSAHCLDNDFIMRNPDFNQLVSYIDYDHKRFGWLKFSLDDDDKKALFKNGVDAAYTFLTSFNWEKYKSSRKCL